MLLLLSIKTHICAVGAALQRLDVLQRRRPSEAREDETSAALQTEPPGSSAEGITGPEAHVTTFNYLFKSPLGVCGEVGRVPRDTFLLTFHRQSARGQHEEENPSWQIVGNERCDLLPGPSGGEVTVQNKDICRLRQRHFKMYKHHVGNERGDGGVHRRVM